MSDPSNAEAQNVPKVSVLVLTYNHARFIEEAVLSTVNQNVRFPYEIVVGDDCSNDGTREILARIAAQYPDKIRLVLRERNLGLIGKRNLAETLKVCRGDYVAFVEGDDYWCSAEKLQRQADYLDSHPEHVAVFHDILLLSHDQQLSKRPVEHPYGSTEAGIAELLQFGFPHLSALMFRRSALPEYPQWFFELGMGDWSHHLLLASKAPYGYLRECFHSVYRLHATSYWLGRPFLDRNRDELAAFQTYLKTLPACYHWVLNREINRREFWFIDAYLDSKDPTSAKMAFRHAIWGWPKHRGESFKKVSQYAARLYFPTLWRKWRKWRSSR